MHRWNESREGEKAEKLYLVDKLRVKIGWLNFFKEKAESKGILGELFCSIAIGAMSDI